ncbi:MAG TPA: TIGR02266 family protein [Polyangiaceae bacterium]|nr:TIGR02266 family protein [Polyangiaceae bacterium]
MAARVAKPADLRAYPRRHVEIDITLVSESQFYAGFSENLSEGGIFVATHATAPIGTRVDITFSLPRTQRRVRAEGEVRWIRPHSESSGLPAGMGIRFISLGEADARAIREFCAQRTPLFFDE